ncbi:DUF1152 domain-containing protein [Sinosporangium siamense]|uniref:DUF1152 domain-containing protein n=1 Tax=Sinosporangium siamense TaxID=1367973 RepID=A0A919RCQ3_9ACTN|nr:DUF1152 domain-containing protein [Sinosporangium siamense]GII91510.1 hypothetical protein Ssi02_17410 [Sinosporangium siamense]
MSLDTVPFFTRLAGVRRVLIAGAGGGHDVYAGLPVALTLMERGVAVTFANLTFSPLTEPGLDWMAPGLARVHPDLEPDGPYFPELRLSRWLRSRDRDAEVYALEKTGVRPLTRAYRQLVEALGGVDAVVLVDGGTDILMRGDEAGLGTPGEDLASVAAVAALPEAVIKLVLSIGFGVDTYHGVCHAHVLENLAALSRDGGYLGAFSVPGDSPEGLAFLDAVNDAAAVIPERASIPSGSIAAAVRGEAGHVATGARELKGEVFVNPLMALYFAVELDVLVRHCLYMDLIGPTETAWQVHAVIEGFRKTISLRPRRALPF